MSRSQDPKSASAAEQRPNGNAPSASFRILLQAPSPSDPRAALPKLAALVADYALSNDRMALGLRIGFRELETRFGRRPSRQS